GVFVEGRQAILESFLARPGRAQRHVIANTVVDVEDENHARAFSVIVLYMGDKADDGGLPVQDPKSPLIGTFTDKLVRTDEGWRFAERAGGLDFRPELPAAAARRARRGWRGRSARQYPPGWRPRRGTSLAPLRLKASRCRSAARRSRQSLRRARPFR